MANYLDQWGLCFHLCLFVCYENDTKTTETDIPKTWFRCGSGSGSGSAWTSDTSVNSDWFLVLANTGDAHACRAGKWDVITSRHRRHIQDAFECQVWTHVLRTGHLWSDLSGGMLRAGAYRDWNPLVIKSPEMEVNTRCELSLINSIWTYFSINATNNVQCVVAVCQGIMWMQSYK